MYTVFFCGKESLWQSNVAGKSLDEEITHSQRLVEDVLTWSVEGNQIGILESTIFLEIT